MPKAKLCLSMELDATTSLHPLINHMCFKFKCVYGGEQPTLLHLSRKLKLQNVYTRTHKGHRKQRNEVIEFCEKVITIKAKQVPEHTCGSLSIH